MVRKIAVLSLLVLFALPAVCSADRVRRRPHRRPRAAQVIEEANSPQDMLRVYVSYARQRDGQFVVRVVALWGDLDKQIDRCSPEHYANWDGSLTVDGGTVAFVRKLAFEDRRNAEPAEGSGVDKLGDQTDTQIVWQSGVVGAVDGLMFKVAFDSLDSVATLEVGGFTVTISPTVFTPPPEATEQPDGADGMQILP